MFNSSFGTPFTMPVAPAGNGYGYGDSFGGWFFWIIILILLFNGNGWGNNGQASTVYEGYVLNNDMSQLARQISDSTAMTERKLDGIANGICSLGYDQLNQMNGINNNVVASTNAIQGSLTDARIAAMQNQNALQTQISQCCCDNRAATKDLQYSMANLSNGTNTLIGNNFAELNYNLATQDCNTRRTVTDTGREIIMSQDNSTRAILAAIEGLKDSQKDEKIATLQTQLSDARLIANNNAQTAVFTAAINDAVAKLTPVSPVPSYSVPAPFPYSGCACSGCNC